MGAIAQLVQGLRVDGVTVHEWPGWQGRGNEDISEIEPHGAVIHHTGTAYGSAFAGLASSTRPDLLGGALCNFAGNDDGSLTVIASGLSWHAGQGVGPALGALYPWRNRLNLYSVGLEIVYPGDQPMRPAQYVTAVTFARAVADMFGGGNVECIRAHAETNGNVPGGDGKWDPGFAPGRVIDMAAFRHDVETWTRPGGQPEPITPKRKKVTMFSMEVTSGAIPPNHPDVVGTPLSGGVPQGFACIFDSEGPRNIGMSSAASVRDGSKAAFIPHWGCTGHEMLDAVKQYTAS